MKRIKKKDQEEYMTWQDENFAFIAGYTSAGFSYGQTWEEMEEYEKNKMKTEEVVDHDLPF